MKRNRKFVEVITTLLLTTLFSASAIPISESATKPKSADEPSTSFLSGSAIKVPETLPEILDAGHPD